MRSYWRRPWWGPTSPHFAALPAATLACPWGSSREPLPSRRLACEGAVSTAGKQVISSQRLRRVMGAEGAQIATSMPKSSAESQDCVSVIAGTEAAQLQSKAARLRKGRTANVLAALRGTRLMDFGDSESLPSMSAADVRRGAQAMCQGAPVLIVDAFVRRGVPKCDVAEIVANAGLEAELFEIGHVWTADSTSLTEVGYHYNLAVDSRSGRVVLSKRPSSGDGPGSAEKGTCAGASFGRIASKVVRWE